jgi:hypothetical protein
MTVTIIKKRSQSFAVRIGIAAVLVLAVLGLVVRFLKQHKGISGTPSSHETTFEDFTTLSDTLLVPVIELEVHDRTQEKNWITALAARLGGQSEVTVPYGRVDVLTGTYAIEVDYLHKWKEGIGQALHYASVKGITPCLALIYERTETQTDAGLKGKVRHIEALCTAKGVRLLMLKQR